MIAPALRIPAHTGVIKRASATVSSTVAAVSATSRSRRSRLTCRGRSARTAASARAPARPSRTRDSTRARDTEFSAASAAADSPASGTSSAAMTIRAVGFTGSSDRRSGVVEPDGAEQSRVVATLGLPRGGLVPGGLPLREQRVLQAEHLAFLLGLAVVVPEQVQHAVHGEQRQLVPEAVACLAGLGGGERRTEHDVAEQRRTDLRCV